MSEIAIVVDQLFPYPCPCAQAKSLIGMFGTLRYALALLVAFGHR